MPNVSAPTVEFPTPGGDSAVNALLYGTAWRSNSGSGSMPTQLTYSFSGALSNWAGYPAGGEPATGFVPCDDEALRQAVRDALSAWSSVAAIEFTEVPDDTTGAGTLRLGFTSLSMQAGALAYAYAPGVGASGGDVWLNASLKDSLYSSFELGGLSRYVLLHEIGHALGLKHPAAASPVNSSTLDSATDTMFDTVMSQYGWPGVALNGSNTDRLPSTPMALDIDALRQLYGQVNHHDGDDLYQFDSEGSYLLTLYDTGGNDTLQVNGASGAELDLRSGFWSHIGPPVLVAGIDLVHESADTVQIYRNTLIENATGGAGDDRLIGNDEKNHLTGNAGNDTLAGGRDDDVLTGGAGADTFVLSWWDTDTIEDFNPAEGDLLDLTELVGYLELSGTYTPGADPFATGNIFLQQDGQNVILRLDQDGSATVHGLREVAVLKAANASQILAANITPALKPVTSSTEGDDIIDGKDISDSIDGGGGNDRINGLGGDDTLKGGLGNDTLEGGAGNDSEDGADGDDSLFGGEGDDDLIGGRGNDTLDGGVGADRMRGGLGEDTYYVDDLADQVIELDNAPDPGSGAVQPINLATTVDSVVASINYLLGNYVEYLTLATGSVAVSGSGNALDNLLVGNQAANTLLGLGGDDTLQGGLGNDSLDGGIGLDTARFAGQRAGYRLGLDAQGYRVTDIDASDGDEGVDLLIAIEQISFADLSLSLGPNHPATGSLVLQGNANEGTILNTVLSVADLDGIPSGAGALHYQWFADGQAISSANGSSLLLGREQAGRQVSVGLQYTDELGHAESLSSAPRVVTSDRQFGVLAFDWHGHRLLDGVGLTYGTQVASTGAAGSARLVALDTSEPLSASRTVTVEETTATAAAVDLQDAIAILKMVVGLDVNGPGKALSAYQLLAADMDGNGSVQLSDAIAVLKHVVGLPAPDPSWHFVRDTDPNVAGLGTHQLQTGSLPSTLIDAAATSPQVALVGYLRGDVNGSFAPVTPTQTLAQAQPDYFLQLFAAHPELSPSQFGIYS